MFNYIANNVLSEDNFLQVCKEIEYIKGVIKGKSIIDVDGTKLQQYLFNGNNIVVIEDLEMGSIIVNSEINLDNTFHKK